MSTKYTARGVWSPCPKSISWQRCRMCRVHWRKTWDGHFLIRPGFPMRGAFSFSGYPFYFSQGSPHARTSSPCFFDGMGLLSCHEYKARPGKSGRAGAIIGLASGSATTFVRAKEVRPKRMSHALWPHLCHLYPPQSLWMPREWKSHLLHCSGPSLKKICA